MNAAHSAAKRLVISPVAAARFIVAKMRASEGPKPKLGGVYMLRSCARTFAGEAFTRQHFILGDFFCVEPDSIVKFDTEMCLKEDYDFTCSHIAKYGSVLRCNRMTLSVKHYSNSGGACTNRDKKGLEEQRNIAILHGKWPGCFRSNPRRKNEVIMRWKTAGSSNDNDDDEEDERHTSSRTATVPQKAAPKKGGATVVKKTIAKRSTDSGEISPQAKASYIAGRCAKAMAPLRGEDGTDET